MKNLTAILVTVLLVSSSVFAKTPAELKAEQNLVKSELTLLEGLKSSNDGVRLSSAYYLGELKSEKAMLPLMSMLRNGSTAEERISAALALSKLNNERANYLLKRTAELDSDERVAKICKVFYNANKG
jgi:HEAT repeat protein